MNLTKKTALLLALVVTGLVATDSALAQRGRGHAHARVGVFVGIPIGFGWPYWYYPPYYYYPPYPSQVVVVPSQPQTYIQMEGAQPAPESQGYWYYCADSQAYYPYVKECPRGWQRVAPRPPG